MAVVAHISVSFIQAVALALSLRSSATLPVTRPAKVVFGVHPSLSPALVASPSKEFDLGGSELSRIDCNGAVSLSPAPRGHNAHASQLRRTQP